MLHVAGGTRQLKRRWRFLRAGKKLEKLYMLALSSSPQIVVVSKKCPVNGNHRQKLQRRRKNGAGKAGMCVKMGY